MARNASVFEFQGSKMIVSVKGPNINKNFTMNKSFQPNLLSSTMNMPHNFLKQSSSSSVASQRSIYYARDTSPTASTSRDLQPRNFHRRPYNREGSPMSVRSIGSTASRTDIVLDLINTYNEDEQQMIADALNRQIELRKKAQKYAPQSLKSFDCLSEDTYRTHKNAYTGYARSESQSEQANMFPIQRNNLNGSMYLTKNMQNITVMSQKNRFRGGFQFPSERFDRSALHEEQDEINNQLFTNNHCVNKEKTRHGDHNDQLSDENDDIFSDTTVKPKRVAKISEKRKVGSLDDIPNPTKKKPKLFSSNDTTQGQLKKKDDNENNEFKFIEPLCIRKTAAKSREKLISKSSRAPDLFSNTQEKENTDPQPALLSPEPDVELEQSQNTQLTTSDMSMRPSFMKRKLFTQTLDVTEKKNNSFESGTDSPQSNIYSALTREKHKTRKLVTTQSLLSRDVNQDDENLLDLIHKIVPQNQLNLTIKANTSKQPNLRVSGTKNANVDDKWDITSIISTCNNDSVSETYTDDEIFGIGSEEKNGKAREKPVLEKVNTGDKKNKPVKANEKLKKASHKLIKANDEPIQANDKPIKANNKPVKPNCKSIKSKEKPIKTNDKPQPKVKNAESIINSSNNKNGKGVANKTTMPVALCPAERAARTRSRVDAFWDTDDSDGEGAPARRPTQPFNLRDETQDQIASPHQSRTREIKPDTLLKKRETNTPKVLCPIIVLQDSLKYGKKQLSKKDVNETKNETETLKKSHDIVKVNKLDNTGKEARTIMSRTRKQLKLSAMSETVNNSLLNEKAPTKTATPKKQNYKSKTAQKKNAKSKPSSEIKKNLNKKQNDSQHQINCPKKPRDTTKSQNTLRKDVKTTKLRESTESLDMDTCKVLRSRIIDLSSSFNSDKFELTMSRTRKSLTPRKRISFNKLTNVLIGNNKIRNRATKT